jgi:circadian clock protein KaiC
VSIGKKNSILKSPTGISGLDQITYGGLPKGRSTLICGGPGCGKSLFAMEFIANGINLYNEPGVFVSFEESGEEIEKNAASLGINIPLLRKKKLLELDYVHIERNDIEETGEYNLDGLFIRLNYLIVKLGAKRIALNTLESLFSGLSNHNILRSELRRLFRWLKDKGVTAIITGEAGATTLTRQGLEEYVSDCVIFLDHRVKNQYSTRRLRVIKYRGSYHGTNEYPYLITDTGISVLPVSSLRLEHEVSHERISTGIEGLDDMMEGKGYYKGTTLLISGTAGTGKTSMVMHFINEICRRGEKCLYISMEESKNQVFRNMKSIGLDLKKWENKGLLHFKATRPTFYSNEMHLVMINKFVSEIQPLAVIIDPITNFSSVSSDNEANQLLTRLIDSLKEQKITTILTCLAEKNQLEKTDVSVSSIVDTWILLNSVESNGERNRTIFILKSRGMAHSNQVREFILNSKGIDLVDVYVGKSGILTGSVRKAQVNHDKHSAEMNTEERKILAEDIARIKKIASAKMEVIKSEYESRILEMQRTMLKMLEESNSRQSGYKEDALIRIKNKVQND